MIGLEKRRKHTKKERATALLLAAAMLLTNTSALSCVEAADGADAEVYCGMEAHTHTQEECYQKQRTRTCGKDETEGHTHTEACQEEHTILICTLEEDSEHTHGTDCYKTVSELACKKTEAQAHEHTDACYTEVETLICQKTVHQHSSACYTKPDEESADSTADEISPQADTENENTQIDLGAYTQPLIIYNYLYCSNPDHTDLSVRKGDTFALSGAAAVDVEIGADRSASGYNQPIAQDILVSLASLTVPEGKSIKVKPVYYDTDGNAVNRVDMTVKEASAISRLIVEKNASLHIKLEADLTIRSLELGKAGSVSFDLNGHTLKLEDTKESAEGAGGDVSISGSGTAEGVSMACENLEITDASLKYTDIAAGGTIKLKNAVIEGSASGKITAGGNIMAESSTVKETALFGYDATASGEVVMSFTSCTFSNVATVGAGENCQAQVSFAEGSSVSEESGSGYVRDYKITYYTADNELSPEDGWLRSYRVKSNAFTNGASTLLGAGTQSGYTDGEKTLPAYTEAGYGYGGWKIDNAGEAITELSKETGDLKLYAVLAAGTVAVTLDLGFVPSGDNSDDAEELLKKYTVVSDDEASRIYSGVAKLGDSISLDEPQRFGYVFKGWKIDKEEEQEIYTDSYTIRLADLAADGTQEGNYYTLRMEAQWEVDGFPVNFTFAGIEAEYIQISLDGGAHWQSPKEALAKNTYWSWDSSSHQMRPVSTAAYIQYGETLEAYFQRLGFQYPQIRDSRSVSEDVGESAKSENFLTWAVGTLPVDQTVAYDTEKLLTEKGSRTWEAYQEELKISPVTLITTWGTMDYQLSVPQTAGWSYYINGAAAVPENGILMVPNKATVTFASTYSSGEKASVWSLTAANGTELYLNMREYHPGDDSYQYDFIMPASNVKAEYGKNTERYIDISKSPITFAENVSYNGKAKMTGFWYGEKVPGVMMPLFGTNDIGDENGYGSISANDDYEWYFYEFDFSENFYVTSNNQETKNQLTLINALTVYLKECKLVATDDYQTQVSGRKINSTVMENIGSEELQKAFGAEGSLSDYGSIVLDNSSNFKYTINLYSVGENTVASIMQSKLNTYANYYGSLNICGQSDGDTPGAVKLGSAFMNGTIDLRDLSVESYGNQSEYLLFSVGSSTGYGTITIRNCHMDAKEKRLYSGMADVSISGSSAVKIGSIFGAQQVKTADASYTRVYKELMTARGLTISGSSSLVIDGELIAKSHSASQNETVLMNSTGYLIVKGNRCELVNFAIQSGTILANDISVAYQGTMTGGTVITNHLMNYGANMAQLTGDGYYSYTAVKAEGIEPFATYSNPYNGVTAYSFTGGEVYLFGYHKENGGSYDLTVKATDLGNPIAPILEKLLDAEGDLSPNAALAEEDLKQEVSAASAENAEKECVILGNSEYNDGTRKRTIELGGSEIYAAGNVNFFNDTNMTGGIVKCAGHFSSALDLAIAGGRVEASMVGNSDKLIYTDSLTKMSRWQTTVISGGVIRANRIGALKDDESTRSTIDITGGELKSKEDAGQVALVHDVYINYIAGGETELPAGNPQTVRFTGAWEEEWRTMSQASLRLVTTDLDEEEAVMIRSADGRSWMLDSLSGPEIDCIDTDGTLKKSDVKIDQATAILREDGEVRRYLSLYEAKSAYQLTVKQGSENVGNVMVSGEQKELDSAHCVQAERGGSVTIELTDTKMKDKTVVWYYDAAGILHNVMPAFVEENGKAKVSFTMPAADVEVFVTDELTLYLDRYEILFQENGFRVEFEESREDSAFSYYGSYKITQSNLEGHTVSAKEAEAYGKHATVYVDETLTNSTQNETYLTKNRLKFETSNMDADRIIQYDVTLEKVLQDYASGDPVLAAGLIVGENLNIAVKIQGTNQLCVTDVPATSQIYFYGDTKEHDQLCVQTRAFNRWDMGFVGTAGDRNREAGRAYFKNLNIMQLGNIFMIARSYKKSQNTVTLENCRSRMWHYYAGSGIVGGYQDVQLIDSEFEMYEFSDTSSAPFSNTTNVDIIDTKISYEVGGGRGGSSLFSGVTDMNIEGSSEIVIKDIYSTDTLIRKVLDGTDCNVTLKDQAKVTADRRLRLSKLTMSDNSQFTVNGSEGGYLFCQDITVNGGTLETDYLINSGYNQACESEVAGVRQLLENNQNLLDGASSGGLTVNGGKVTVREFAGGNKNSKITVTGGELNVKRAGTCETSYGIAYYTPKATEEYVYTYTRIPLQDEGADIKVSGGSVNVSEGGYLGGMNAEIEITSGSIALGDGAVLGMTEEQKTDLSNYYSSIGDNIAAHKEKNIQVKIAGGKVEGNGNINTPYGQTEISGTSAAVRVNRISALSGTVEISGTAAHYENPLTGQTHSSVGVLVEELLTAETVLIREGAVVYAKKATSFAESGGTGLLAVQTDEEKAYLYTEIYGSDGEGSVTIKGEEEKQIIGSRQFSIYYHLRDDVTDRAENSSENPYVFEYQANSEDMITLKEPVRNGYRFMGWYETAEYAEEQSEQGKIAAIRKSVSGNVDLYAAWEPLEVPFRIVIDNSENVVENLDEEIAGLPEGTIKEDNSRLIFEKTVSVAYLDHIFGTGENHIHLSDFGLPSYSVEALFIAEDEWAESTRLDQISSIVTNELLHFYLKKAEEDPDAVITLQAEVVAKRNQKLTMDLNLNDRKRPVNAVFQKDENTANQPAVTTSTTISSHASVGATVANASGFVIGGKLNQPSAPGYTFEGWYTDKNCTSGNEINSAYQVTSENASYFYAKWTPNEYQVIFDAGEDGVITKNSSEPGGSEQQCETAYVIYDTVIDGHVSYSQRSEGDQTLPYAWKKGFKFLGWSADQGKTLIEKQELNCSTFETLDLVGETALTLTAVYRSVQITYMTDGGQFTSRWLDENAEGENIDGGYRLSKAVYGEGLAGYTKEAVVADDDSYELFGVSDKDSTTYAVVSTTSSQYKNEKTFVKNDYRYAIGKKGYTFKGWNTKKDGTGTVVGTVPEYEDITVYAQWSANRYTLNLNKGESRYSHIVAPDSPKSVQVVAGQEVKTEEKVEVKVDNWPDRSGENAWYAYSQTLDKETLSENNKRYLLGFTFDQFEPGDSLGDEAGIAAYDKYAQEVLSLLNKNCLFTKAEGDTEGSVFALPADQIYSASSFGSADAVPDYPAGSTIEMYAVYRERSLVFVERYVDTNTGEIVQEVLHSAPYYAYDAYPERYADSERKRQIEAQGYTLLGWYVNSKDAADSRKYTQANYTEEMRDTWLEEAENTGTYDIMVYTVYAAQVTRAGLEMRASTSPTAEHGTQITHSIPKSMRVGTANYEIRGLGGLKLVSKEKLDQSLYEKAGADDTVSILMELIDSEGKVQEEIWLEEAEGRTEKAIGADWKIRMTLYHSHVIGEEKTFRFDIAFTFNGSGLEEQSLTWEQESVHLIPTEWTVNYTAVLPTDNNLVVEEDNGYEKEENPAVYTLQDQKWIYGTALQSLAPELEGYTADGSWIYQETQTGEERITYGAAGTMKLTEKNRGVINLKTTYKVNSYALSVKEEQQKVLGKWNITYQAQEGQVALGQAAAEVEYHKEVILKPQGTQEAAYIWLNVNGKKYRLDRLTEEGNRELFHAEKEADGAYSFLMPAYETQIEYCDVLPLYLENGTIDITEKGYTQTGIVNTDGEVYWPGDYRILQNEADSAEIPTEYVLTLAGNLSSRTIELGNLNISSGHSIELKDEASAKLTAAGTVIGKNILVPSGANLMMESGSEETGETVNAKIALEPEPGIAAIGGCDDASEGKAACGTITLRNLDLALTMPAGSAASGIGSGNGTEGGKDVTVSGCSVAVTEKSTQSAGAYQGVWIGGKNIQNVTIQNTEILLTESKSAGTITDGVSVKLTGSCIGSSEDAIEDHYVRGGNLFIDSSEIFLSASGGSEALLAAENTIYVDEGITDESIASVIAVTGSQSRLYGGTMKLYRAESDVVIANTQIVDVNNQNVTIEKTGITQDGSEHEHTGNYLLLSEFDAYQGATNVNVVSLNSGMKITAGRDDTDTVEITDLRIQADTAFVPMGTVTVTGSTVIEEGKTLHVTADTESELKFTQGFEVEGNYKQEGGKVTSESGGLLTGGNMTLIDVNAEAEGQKVGSSGKNGVTTVTIDGGSVKAQSIGAQGEQDATFTFVKIMNTPKITGEVIQDHYRLNYVLEDENFDKTMDDQDQKQHTVLRSVSVYTDGSLSGQQTCTPAIPGNPKYTGSDKTYFENWYIITSEGNMALSESAKEGFARYTALNAELVSAAGDTESEDGTWTLDLYAWMRLRGDGAITYGRELNKMETAEEETVSIENDGAWTARFIVEGTVISDSEYQFNFTSPLPAGTKLTLADRSTEGAVSWYYYIVPSEGASAIPISSFVRMGGAEKAEKPSGEEGEQYLDKLQLSADFADVIAEDGEVKLVLKAGESELPIAEVTYRVADRAAASVKADQSTVSAEISAGTDTRLNGTHVYLTAELFRNGTEISVPYDAQISLTGQGGQDTKSGIWIGGNKAVFDLGAYQDQTNASYTWNAEGLQPGEYSVKWHLTAAEKEGVNVFDRVLASSEDMVVFSVSGEEEPRLAVTLTSVDGKTKNQVLAGGTGHEALFTYETNARSVVVTVEKQGILQDFQATGTQVTANGKGTEVPIPAESGTYRVRFSINGQSDWDDVYYTFIVK